MAARKAMMLVVLSICCAWAQSAYSMREIKITTKGELLGITLVLQGYEVYLSGTGELIGVETVVFPDNPLDYRYADDRIDRIQKGTVTCLIDGGKIQQVGDLAFKYLSTDEKRIGSIGDTVFSYQFVDGKTGYIERIGNLEFHYLQKRLESVGSLRIEYRKQDGNVERFTRNLVKDREAPFNVRICVPSVKSSH